MASVSARAASGSRFQRLLIGAAISLLFIEKHLNVNMFDL
jgi:hypothetical protein